MGKSNNSNKNADWRTPKPVPSLNAIGYKEVKPSYIIDKDGNKVSK